MDRPSAFTTSMMDINDDCLLAVFKHFGENELCEVADVCTRFRFLAQETFRTSEFETFELEPYGNQLSEAEIFERTRKAMQKLRNFGENIERIWLEPHYHLDKISTYVSRYCGENLISFRSENIHITDAIAIALRATIRNVREIELIDCKFGPSFLENLQSLSPNLRSLGVMFYEPTRRIDLHQSIPQLKTLEIAEVYVDDIEAFLRLNPQLKKVVIRHDVGDSIFELVAKHVPTIKELEVNGNPRNTFHLNQLRLLKTLSLSSKAGDGPPALEPAIELTELTLDKFDFRQMGTEITRLKSLRTLSLHSAVNLTAYQIIDILNECSRLEMLFISGTVKLFMMNLIDILLFGRSLRVFNYSTDGRRIGDNERIKIDAAAYLKMVNIVKSRSATGVHMVIHSTHGLYVNEIPVDLLRAHRRVLNLFYFDSDNDAEEDVVEDENENEDEEGEEDDGEVE